MPTVIEFAGISKEFILDKGRSRSLQEAFMSLLKQGTGFDHTYPVLRDVNFAIKSGESVALIGANGAGKSTILKLISSIIVPSAGRIEINGRISSLLDLGTGFHPDLSGRENVYLNGSILGLSKADIEAKYDDIVAFADIGEYIDVSVKHYSAGMYLRLAFAVASHVEPDILLIDEAMAVGDHIFQQRCLKRIAELKSRGVTLILVSHDMNLIRHYCNRGIWLENGRIQEDGDISRVIEMYLTAQYQAQSERDNVIPERLSTVDGALPTDTNTEVTRWGSGDVEFTNIEILNANYQPQSTFIIGDCLILRMHYYAEAPVSEPVFGMAIYRADGLHINGPNTKHAGLNIGTVQGQGYIDYAVEALHLLPGSYEISVAVYDTNSIQAYDHHQRLYRFQMLPGDINEAAGVCHLPAEWNHTPEHISEPDEVVINGTF